MEPEKKVWDWLKRKGPKEEDKRPVSEERVDKFIHAIDVGMRQLEQTRGDWKSRQRCGRRCLVVQKLSPQY